MILSKKKRNEIYRDALEYIESDDRMSNFLCTALTIIMRRRGYSPNVLGLKEFMLFRPYETFDHFAPWFVKNYNKPLKTRKIILLFCIAMTEDYETNNRIL